MASPFRYFRKHTKAAMAILFVVCMFLFVFVTSPGGGGGRGSYEDGSASVATWKGGSLDQLELNSLVRQRLIVNEFLERIFVQGGGRRFDYDLPASVPNLMVSSRRDLVEAAVINAEVMASLARQAGITVSDDMVNHYIREFGLNNVAQDEILGILGSVGQNDMRENEAIVFSMLRKMLAAHFYRTTYADATAVVLPEQRWEDWRLVNERISLTAAELPVESFEKDVPEPSESDLLGFYEKHKDFDPNVWLRVDSVGTTLPAPTPGFAEPRRVRLAFLLGSVGERTEQLLDKVTEEEIADYYERNKRTQFVKTDFGSEEDEPAPAGEESPTEQPSAEEGAEGAVDSASGTTPADEQPPAAEPPADAEEASTPSEPATPAEEATAPAPTGEAPATPSEGASSTRKRQSPFRLAALQTELEEDPAAAESAPNGKAAEDAPAADSTSSSGAPDTPAESEAPAAESHAAAPADAAPATNEASEATADEEKSADELADEILEYEPLEKVRDEIRQTLARDKAVEELGKVINEAAAELQAEYRDYGLEAAMAEEQEKPAPKPPEKLADLQWLADKYKLKYEKTALLTDRELLDTAVGKAADVRSGNSNVTGAAFVTLRPFEPLVAKELEGDWYLVVKTEDQPRRVPEFSEIRDRVAAAWKREKAAELAEKKAEELAKEASESTQPFDAFFKEKGYEVVPQTELFSFLSYPLGPGQAQPPSLSKVPPLKNVGPAFMEAAFSLKDDETKGLMNFDRSAAYVIRLHTRQYPEDELKQLFLKDDSGFWPGGNEMRYIRIRNANDEVQSGIVKERADFEYDEEWLKRRQELEQEAG